MRNDWDTIAGCLRGEIAEYGGLLNLLDEQRALIFKRDLAAVVQLNHTIHGQVEVLGSCRERREAAAREFAAAHLQPSARTLRALLPFVSEDGRPLIAALIAEINHLVHRLRRGMALNQRLLACTVGVQQEFIRQLWPAALTKTYGSDGSVSVGRNGRVPSLQTAG